MRSVADENEVQAALDEMTEEMEKVTLAEEAFFEKNGAPALFEEDKFPTKEEFARMRTERAFFEEHGFPGEDGYPPELTGK